MSSCCQKKLVYFNMVHHPIKDRLLSRLCRSLSLSLLLPHIDLISKQNMPVFFFFFGIHWNILLRTKPFLVFYRSSQWPTQGSGCSLKGMYPHLSFLQWLEMPNPGHYDPPSQKKCYESYVITLITPPPPAHFRDGWNAEVTFNWQVIYLLFLNFQIHLLYFDLTEIEELTSPWS